MGTKWKASFSVVLKLPLLFLGCFLLLGVYETRAAEPISVSMVQLIANPEKYNGKFVRVEGYLHVKFENSGLYLSKDAADYLIDRNALWISYAENIQLEPAKELKYFDCRWVLLEGYVDAQVQGHMGMYSGGLKQVSRVMELTHWYDGEKQLRK